MRGGGDSAPAGMWATHAQRQRPAISVRKGLTAVTLIAWACALLYAWASGPSWSWDRAHYHVYAGYQWVNDTFGRGYLPAGGQTYLNPLGYVPQYLMMRAGWSELAMALVLASVHTLAIPMVWLICFQHTRRADTAFIAAALAFCTPVYVSQLGTSYLDITTAVLFCTGAAAIVSARRVGERASCALLVTAGLLMGAATGLKLSNVIPLLTTPILVCWGFRAADWRSRIIRLLSWGAAAFLGLAAAAAPWGLQLHERYGNPIYPMFESMRTPTPTQAPDPARRVAEDPKATPLESEAAASEAPAADAAKRLAEATRPAGGRFTPRSIAEVASFPLRIADPRLPWNLSYLEWLAPDPRPAMLLLLTAFMMFSVLKHRATLDVGTDVARPAVDSTLLAWIAATVPIWLHTSANGRYAMPLLLLIAVPIAQIITFALRGAHVRRCTIAATLIVSATSAFLIQERADLPVGRNWTEPVMKHSIPARLVDEPWLHLRRTIASDSFILMYMHPQSALASIQDSDALRDVLRQWHGRVRFIGPPNSITPEGPTLSPSARIGIDATIGQLGLRLDMSDCETISTDPGFQRAYTSEKKGDTETINQTSVLLSCAAREDPFARERSAKIRAQHDDVFQMIERRCSDVLAPSADESLYIAEGVWRRSYTQIETDVTVRGGKVMARTFKRGDTPLGTLESIRANPASIDCSLLR